MPAFHVSCEVVPNRQIFPIDKPKWMRKVYNNFDLEPQQTTSNPRCTGNTYKWKLSFKINFLIENDTEKQILIAKYSLFIIYYYLFLHFRFQLSCLWLPENMYYAWCMTMIYELWNETITFEIQKQKEFEQVHHQQLTE